MPKKLKIRVAMPTKNEEENVGYMIKSLRKYGFSDIYIVDEQSEDRTEEIAKSMGVPVYQRKGKGKGMGVIEAIEIAKKSKTDYMIFPDCDRTYHPKYIPKIIKFIPKYDMVVACRDMKDIKFFHRLPNMIHTLFINLFYNGRMHDINSGMRAINVNKFYKKLDAKGFDIEAQISIVALKEKMKIKELSIQYEERKGFSKIRIKDGFIILARIFKELFR
ncbi:glycosyltransferase [Candidatus Woesearchaeota archaeon]|nr:glycosyltransferase [Candidatus Woesearchaeota archaeon]